MFYLRCYKRISCHLVWVVASKFKLHFLLLKMSCVPDETFYSVLNEVELLEESIDPPERPFDSKYKAAQILVCAL